MSKIKRVVEAQNQPIEYLVLSGGGAKGVIYSGVFEGLSDANIVPSLKGVAGSSAGAITAAFIATGISKEDCQKLSQETNFSDLLGSGVPRDGKPMYSFLHETIANNIKQYTNHLDLKRTCSLRIADIENQFRTLKKNPEGYTEEELKIVQQRLSDEKEKLLYLAQDGASIKELQNRVNRGGKVYFKDLAMLKLLDPSKFKDLIITATNRETGELKIFNAEETPDVEIALACRASAAIPRVIKPTTIDGVDYVDGGYRDNIPQKYFKSDLDLVSNPPKRKGRTMALAFGQDIKDSANIAIYSSRSRVLAYNAFVGFLINIISKIGSGVGGYIGFADSEEKVYKNLRENALNVIVLSTGSVGTLSFKTAQDQAAYLHIKGRMQTLEHLLNHDLIERTDTTFEHKNFMLSVYEQSLIHLPKTKKNNEVLQELLSFCDKEKWPPNKSTSEVLREFIQTAATNTDGYRLTTKTKAIEALIMVLNDPRTPNIVKTDFIDTLGINIGPVAEKHLVHFKFKREDFEELINRHKEHEVRKQSIDIVRASGAGPFIENKERSTSAPTPTPTQRHKGHTRSH